MLLTIIKHPILAIKSLWDDFYNNFIILSLISNLAYQVYTILPVFTEPKLTLFPKIIGSLIFLFYSFLIIIFSYLFLNICEIYIKQKIDERYYS